LNRAGGVRRPFDTAEPLQGIDPGNEVLQARGPHLFGKPLDAGERQDGEDGRDDDQHAQENGEELHCRESSNGTARLEHNRPTRATLGADPSGPYPDPIGRVPVPKKRTRMPGGNAPGGRWNTANGRSRPLAVGVGFPGARSGEYTAKLTGLPHIQ
jgi:hypothetical protein